MIYFEIKPFKIFRRILYILLITILGGILLSFLRQDAIPNMGLTNFVLLMFILFFISASIDSAMYFHYYKYNKRWTLRWYMEQRKFIVTNNYGSFNISLDDIEYIEQVRTFSFAKGRMQIFFTDSYNYSFVKLKNGENFIITSLLIPKLEFHLESDRIKLTKTFLCYIRRRHKK